MTASTKTPETTGDHSVTPSTDPNKVPEGLKETAPHAPIRDSDPAPDPRAPVLGEEPETGANPMQAPIFTRIPRTWEPDPIPKSRAVGPVKAVELANFGGPDITPQGVPPLPENPDITPQGVQPIKETRAAPVIKEPVNLDDEDSLAAQVDIPTTANPVYVKSEPQPTTRLPPVRGNTGERKAVNPPPPPPKADPNTSTGRMLSQKALEEEDARAKRRDLHVTLLISAVGILLIGIVYKVTMYEEPVYDSRPFRPTVYKGLGGQQGGGGGGAKGGGAKAKGKGGEDNNPFKKTAITPLAAETCGGRCSQRQQSCANTCGKSERCRSNCLDNLNRCEERCGATVGSLAKDDSDLDCWAPDGRRRRCTQAEQKALDAQAAAAMKSLCRASNGEIIACPQDVAKLEAARKHADKQCGPDGCAGSD